MKRKRFSRTAFRLLAIFQDFCYNINPNLYKYMTIRDRRGVVTQWTFVLAPSPLRLLIASNLPYCFLSTCSICVLTVLTFMEDKLPLLMRSVNQEQDVAFDRGKKNEISTVEIKRLHKTVLFLLIRLRTEKHSISLRTRYCMIIYDILLNSDKIQVQLQEVKEQWHY